MQAISGFSKGIYQKYTVLKKFLTLHMVESIDVFLILIAVICWIIFDTIAAGSFKLRIKSAHIIDLHNVVISSFA